jgi:histidyl-tRNA synthetase
MKLIPLTTQLFYKRAITVAEHYGFHSVEELRPSDAKSVLLSSRDLLAEQANSRIDYHALPDALRDYASAVELRKKEAFMFYSPSIVTHPSAPSERIQALTLSTVGTHDPLSEIVILKTAVSILEELNVKHARVRINSVGDGDSSTRFLREITAQLRQRARELPEDILERFRVNPTATISYLYESRHPITYTLPGPIDFLTAPSRKYFKEVLELIEHSDIPFELDDKLYGDHRTYSHTIFEIVVPDDSSPLRDATITVARGGRYDSLTRAYTRGVVPASGIVIALRTKDVKEAVIRPRRVKPTACLIHIGREAQICSIGIIENFRRENIPIEQCLQFERFSEQLAYAESHNVKYVIILGQREAHERIAIVRNARDRSQHNVPIDGLAHYLKTVAV